MRVAMISQLLSLALVLQPTPLLVIDLGAEIEPITATRLTLSEPAPSDGAFITPRDWLRIRSALRTSRSVCQWAINETLDECIRGLERDRELIHAERSTLVEVADTYALRLQDTESALNDALKLNTELTAERDLYMWATIGVLGSATIIIVGSLLMKGTP
jgi:hypothetical protein